MPLLVRDSFADRAFPLKSVLIFQTRIRRIERIIDFSDADDADDADYFFSDADDADY